ncbi:vWA domain-containing protein [Haloferula sp.]|uniref:vWA domain-containing protein n=1 Tax=Haloferula sp. TaxID=2497595 RepID=UPI003C750E15
MNKHLTEIAYILDRSGSMNDMVEPAIAGFNQFLGEQRRAPGSARFTLVLFDDEYLVPCSSLPIGEVPELDTSTYVPRSMTALLDAIGRTITDIGKRLATTPEPDRPGQVIVAIFTDGLENASTDYDLKKINAMITHQREHYSWEFLFLGATQDAIATAAKMGISRSNASAVEYSRVGIHTSSTSFSRKMSALRNHSATGEKSADYSAPMEDIVKDEEKQMEEK